MNSKEQRYVSYLLRLWPISSEGRLLWRASLESPKTGQRLGFANLVELFTFLENETRTTIEEQQPPSEAGD
ncbi:MAG: hypothetical protein KDI79_25110 [Anaerolineae bacterium]|nr:hypothetical protein [Anaerolineae bacterium]